MNRLNRKVEYALMALKQMSRKIPGELTTAKEVADSLKTPFDATARVLQMMANHGLLKSEQGALGGYQITKDLSKVSLFDLIEYIEGPTALVKCLQKEDLCDIQSTCNILSPVTQLNEKLNSFYRSLTLKQILVDTPNSKTSTSESSSMSIESETSANLGARQVTHV